MKVAHNLIFTVMISLLLSSLSPFAWANSSDFDINSDAEMDLRYDWVITVKVDNSNYLSYPKSTLKPLTKLQITYRLNPRFIANIPTAGQNINYEELWYHSSQVVGSRRLHELSIPPTYQGAVRIVPSPAVVDNHGAIAGAIVRMTLDVVLQNCKMSIAFVPTSVFAEVVDDLSRFRFGTSQGTSNSEPILLQLYSNPLKLTQLLFYNAG
jgi:hypothetical protein